MPRPKRGRPAPARASRAPPRSSSAEPEQERDDPREQKGRDRGRERTSRRAGRLSLEEEHAIRAANLVRDAALERLAIKDATTTGSSGNEREGSSGSQAEMGRRVLATPAHRGDTTGLDLADDSIFGNLDDSFADVELPPGLRSTDTSIMSMSNFRSRSRQGSFVGNTPGFASSFNIGAFRRRVREPSILGDSRKPLQEAPKNGSGARPESESEGDEDEGEDDFEPEAESTPVNNRRKTRQSLELKQTESQESPDITSSRKRKSEDAHHDNLRPEKTPRTELADQEVQDSDTELSDIQSPEKPDQDSDSELSDLPSPLEPPAFFQRAVTPIDDEEINAPPASSGSEEEDDIWPDIRVLAKKRRRPSITTPSKPDNLSDISSPPSLTHSPNFEEARGRTGRGKPASRQQASPKLTTADLTNLLPKRKHKKVRDPLDLDSDEELDTTGLSNEDDELSFLDTQAARRKKGSRPPSRATSARPASRGGRAAVSQRLKQAQALAKFGQQHAATYSRQSSDKENEEENAEQTDDNGDEDEEEDASRFVPLADDTFDTGSNPSAEVLSADELKVASRKFKEVDRWELDFEEVAEASSPQDGR